MISHANITEVRVRYADTDQMGIANNGMYLTWFEVGRTELMRELGVTYSGIEKAGYYLPLIEAGVKYLKPAHYDDVLSIRSHISKGTRLRIRIEYSVYRSEILLVAGFTEHVFTDMLLKPCRIQKTIAEQLFAVM